MEGINFTETEKSEITSKVKKYFQDELDQEIGSFEAEFLVDFFAAEVGAYFYNRGIYDAQALVSRKVDELSDAIYELERAID